ncbi:MAG TPA: hypothetical protein ACN46V_07255 [Prochlorococcus sp.]
MVGALEALHKSLLLGLVIRRCRSRWLTCRTIRHQGDVVPDRRERSYVHFRLTRGGAHRSQMG